MSEDLKHKFQNIITSADPDVVEAWKAYGEWDKERQEERSYNIPHGQLVVEAVQKGEYIDPTTAGLGVFGFRLNTVDKQGKVGQLLEGLDDEQLGRARANCERMVEVGMDPRTLSQNG